MFTILRCLTVRSSFRRRFGGGLLGRPAFRLTGLATLALGMGVNVAVPDADSLMAFVETSNGEPTGGDPIRMSDYVEWMKSSTSTGGFYSRPDPGVRRPAGARRLR
ncbi:MAG: hypothetical protein ACKV2U_08040 [Bryobacteraceae bacterium]